METSMRAPTPALPLTPASRVLAAYETVADWLKRAARARRNRRQAAALAQCDARMLADIGISRSDVRDAFSEPFWEDPTALLRERAIERRWARRVGDGAYHRLPMNRPPHQTV
jgi:uncharacterized protein YjiS (DUF1127 family)